MQQHHGVDDQVGRFQGALGCQIAGQRGVAAVGGHVIAHRARVVEGRQLDCIHLGFKALRGVHRRAHGARVGVMALENGHALGFVDAGKGQHLLEHLGQFTIAYRHGNSPGGLCAGVHHRGSGC